MIRLAALLLLLFAPMLELSDAAQTRLGMWLAGFLAVHAIFTKLKEYAFAPRGREAEFARTVRLISHGPFAKRHLWVGQVLGILVPLLLLALPASFPFFGIAAAVCALIGLWAEEDILVRAGQAQPIS